MTREDHVKKAEKLLAGTYEHGPWADGSGAGIKPPTEREVALAQVHATLALVDAMTARGLIQ